MIIYTTCGNCNKNINADLSHKEAVAGPGPPRLAAIIQCPECRSEIEVLITTRTREVMG
jgi:DNA-directed RNA polymerase subunit RPC12/RpoP